MPSSFSNRLESAFARHGQLCVGIDPHAELLAEWDLPDTPVGLEQFSRQVLDACLPEVSIIKPQVAFFERFGPEGYRVLQQLLFDARDAGLLVIADAKRGDIGSTMSGYFDAWLSKAAPLPADALTVSPFLGAESLFEIYARALEIGKGVFTLAATSNPEAKDQQSALQSGKTVSSKIVDGIEKLNRLHQIPGDKVGSIGVVIGANVDFSSVGLVEHRDRPGPEGDHVAQDPAKCPRQHAHHHRRPVHPRPQHAQDHAREKSRCCQ